MALIAAINPTKKKRKRRKNTAKKKATTRTTPKPKAKSRKRRKPGTARKSVSTKTSSTKGETMARKKRKSRKRKARRNPTTITRYKNSPRSNPSAGQIIGGVHMKQAAMNVMPMFLGALTAKFFAKKFADGGSEMENWNWKNYAMGLGGTLVAGLVTSALFGGKKKTAQRMFEGGLLICAYKLFTNDIAPKNTTLSTWFSGVDGLGTYDPSGGYGASDEIDWSGDMGAEETLWGDEGEYTEGLDDDFGDFGDLMQTDDGQMYVMGPDGEWDDIGDNDRMGATVGPGPTGTIVDATATMGAIHPDYEVDGLAAGTGSGPVVIANPTMGEYDGMGASSSIDEFAKAYGGGVI